MATIYKAKQGQRLDEVVFEVYGDLRLFETILELNPDLGMFLREGNEVLLVELEAHSKEVVEENPKALW